MISQTAEYALRAVLWLAAHPGLPQTTEQIASGTIISPSYLAKVLQALARAHIVRSHPGPRGGFQLVPSPAALSPLEVVNAIDPIERIQECPLKLQPHAVRLCSLHARLDVARGLVEDTLRSCTIEQLLDENPDRTPLCVERGSQGGVK